MAQTMGLLQLSPEIQLAILANFAAEPRLHPSIFWVLMTYFVFLGAWLLYFFLHFRIP